MIYQADLLIYAPRKLRLLLHLLFCPVLFSSRFILTLRLSGHLIGGYDRDGYSGGGGGYSGGGGYDRY